VTNTVTQKVQFQFLALPAKNQLSARPRTRQPAPAHLGFLFTGGRCGRLRARTCVPHALWRAQGEDVRSPRVLQESLLGSEVRPRTASRICVTVCVCAQVLKLEKSSFAPPVCILLTRALLFFFASALAGILVCLWRLLRLRNRNIL